MRFTSAGDAKVLWPQTAAMDTGESVERGREVGPVSRTVFKRAVICFDGVILAPNYLAGITLFGGKTGAETI
jgi:hypothetical protein